MRQCIWFLSIIYLYLNIALIINTFVNGRKIGRQKEARIRNNINILCGRHHGLANLTPTCPALSPSPPPPPLPPPRFFCLLWTWGSMQPSSIQWDESVRLCFSSSDEQMGFVPSLLPWVWNAMCELQPSWDHRERPREPHRCYPVTMLCCWANASIHLQPDFFCEKNKPLLF